MRSSGAQSNTFQIPFKLKKRASATPSKTHGTEPTEALSLCGCRTLALRSPASPCNAEELLYERDLLEPRKGVFLVVHYRHGDLLVEGVGVGVILAEIGDARPGIGHPVDPARGIGRNGSGQFVFVRLVFHFLDFAG